MLVALFLFLSVFFLIPRNESLEDFVRSSELQKVVIKNGSTKKTKYVNDEGTVTFAADIGYAIMTVTDTENGKLEEYFDAEGNPIPYKSYGYYAVFREYDAQGNNYKNTLLDDNGEPVLRTYGYASSIRYYSEDGEVMEERYYDTEGNPVCTTVFGYGKKNEYDEEGHIIQQSFIDKNGIPMISGLGYATVKYSYYDDGRVENEFYFDEEGNPVRLSLGQYGVHKEYDDNGQNYLQTYLDAKGNPIVTTKGYTTIIRTFFANNTVSTEKYYDLDGNPVSLSEGQYGISHEDGKDSYLDAEGNEQFNIKMLLFNQQDTVILAALIVVVISALTGKKENTLLLALYFGFIIYMTLMFRGSGDSKANMEPLWAYRQIFVSKEARSDVFNNIWLFIPLGAILSKLYPKQIVLIVPLASSILIELTQYVTGTGLCELDDVISNGLGGCIGYTMLIGFQKVISKMNDRIRILKTKRCD